MQFKVPDIIRKFVQRRRDIFFCAGSVILLALIMELMNFSKISNREDNAFNSAYKVLPVPLPDKMNFAGEEVPMNHFGVKEDIEQEMIVNTYWQSQTLLALKRANRYFPIIERILNQNGIPDDFKYLALAESGFSYRVSSAGAAGFWQLMKSTAEANGLEVNKDVDERYDLEKSTLAACRYFKEAYQLFHNWTLVAASYNMGMGGIAKSLAFQKQNNYYDLGLNSETARYVYRILALKELQSSPDKYGFFIRHSELYPMLPTLAVNVDSSINNLADFAISKKLNYRILKLLNPWLLSSKLPNPDKKTYTFILPRKDAVLIDLGENIVYNDSTLSGQVCTRTDTSSISCGTSRIVVHFIKQGESIESVSKKYNVSPEQLRSWNSLNDSATIRQDDEIIIFRDIK